MKLRQHDESLLETHTHTVDVGDLLRHIYLLMLRKIGAVNQPDCTIPFHLTSSSTTSCDGKQNNDNN